MIIVSSYNALLSFANNALCSMRSIPITPGLVQLVSNFCIHIPINHDMVSTLNGYAVPARMGPWQVQRHYHSQIQSINCWVLCKVIYKLGHIWTDPVGQIHGRVSKCYPPQWWLVWHCFECNSIH